MTGSKAIRRALADALRARFPELQVEPYMLSDPTPEAAHVYPSTLEYDLAFQRGLDVDSYFVEVFVAEVSDIGAQDVLDDYLEPDGPLSVKEALELDRTLGGLVDSLQVTGTSGYRRYLRTDGSSPVLGAQWTVKVWKS